MIYVTRKEHFSSAHRLFRPDWSDEKNEQFFDKCNNAAGHGHNYVLEVTIAGEINPETGYLIDLKVLKRIIREQVIYKVDHKNLNVDVDFLRGMIPTAENITRAIWAQLYDKIPDGLLYKISLRETENNLIEYKGD